MGHYDECYEAQYRKDRIDARNRRIKELTKLKAKLDSIWPEFGTKNILYVDLEKNIDRIKDMTLVLLEYEKAEARKEED